MIMMPSRTALSRALAGPAQLLSLVWDRITFSARGNRAPGEPAGGSPDSPPGPTGETGLPRVSAETRTAAPASPEAVAAQMESIAGIVSDQEKAIASLTQRCQRLEDRNQAIMVAFTTFFHVLAAARVAKIDEISAILTDITNIAEREERPQDAITFLRELAAMLVEQTPNVSEGTDAGERDPPPDRT